MLLLFNYVFSFSIFRYPASHMCLDKERFLIEFGHHRCVCNNEVKYNEGQKNN